MLYSRRSTALRPVPDIGVLKLWKIAPLIFDKGAFARISTLHRMLPIDTAAALLKWDCHELTNDRRPIPSLARRHGPGFNFRQPSSAAHAAVPACTRISSRCGHPRNRPPAGP